MKKIIDQSYLIKCTNRNIIVFLVFKTYIGSC